MGELKSEKLIKRLIFCKNYQRNGIAKYLEEMALKGYMFVKKDGYFYCFRRCEPKKVRFESVIVEEALEYDFYPNGLAEYFIKECEGKGWKLVDYIGKEFMFYSEDLDIQPIEVVDEDKFLEKNKKYKKRKIAGCVCSAILLVIFTYLNLSTGYNMYHCEIADKDMLCLCLLLLYQCLDSIIDIVRYNKFVKKNIKRIKEGLEIDYGVHKFSLVSVLLGGFLKIMAILTIIDVFVSRSESGYTMLVVIIFSLYFIIRIQRIRTYFSNKYLNVLDENIFNKRFSKIKVGSANENLKKLNRTIILSGVVMLIIIVVLFTKFRYDITNESKPEDFKYEYNGKDYTTTKYTDTIPFTINDIDSKKESFDYQSTRKRVDENIFARYEYCIDNLYTFSDSKDSIADLYYGTFNSKISWLMKKYERDFMKSEDNYVEKIDDELTKKINCERAYKVQFSSEYDEEYNESGIFLVFDDKIVAVCGDLEFTDDEIARICDYIN